MDKLELFSVAWAEQAQIALNNSPAYQKAAATWEGAMIFRLLADPNQAPADPSQSVYFDLYHGQCQAARVATATDIEAAAYIISADASTWQQVLTGKLEPIAGLLRGKLKLSKGNLAVLVRYVAAAKELVNCAASLDTNFRHR